MCISCTVLWTTQTDKNKRDRKKEKYKDKENNNIITQNITIIIIAFSHIAYNEIKSFEYIFYSHKIKSID
jgi:hypothetical protein